MNKKTLPGIGVLENEDAEAVVQTEVALRSNVRGHKVAQSASTLDRREAPRNNPEESPLNGKLGTKTRADIDRECGDYQHWSPTSQPYAPAHVLLQYLRYDWKLDSTVFIKSFCCLRSRSVDVYYFLLTRNAEQVWMPVLANPVVRRLINESGLTLVRLSADSVASYPTRDEEFARSQPQPFYSEPKAPAKRLAVVSSQSSVYVQ